MSGCSADRWDNATSTVTEGDILPWNYPHMGIPEAWLRTSGAGVTVGIVDTGVDSDQPELLSAFNSIGVTRTHWRNFTAGAPATAGPGWSDTCGHGTHVAGVIGAPKNGQNIVGIAWGANLASVRHDGDVFNGLDVFDTSEAIDMAADDYGSRIINMSFGTHDGFSAVSDMIDYWYARDRLFVGAAGTSFCWTSEGVMFPARLSRVIAVTAVNQNGTRHCSSHYGPEVDLTAVTEQPSVGAIGIGESSVVGSGSSSNSAAIVSGVAALVWSRYPHFTRDQVASRLRTSGSRYPYNYSTDQGWGRINALAAVGGMWRIHIAGVTYARQTVPYSFTIQPYGDGPFAYTWLSDGYTGATRTLTFHGPQRIDTLHVRVRDLVDGRVMDHVYAIQIGPAPTLNMTGPDAIERKNNYEYSVSYSNWRGPSIVWSRRQCADLSSSTCRWQSLSESGTELLVALSPTCSSNSDWDIVEFKVTLTDDELSRSAEIATYLCTDDVPPAEF